MAHNVTPLSESDVVVVATTPVGELPFFPNAIRAQDGSVVAVYREATDHVCSVGRIMFVSSPDGRRWSEPRVVVDTLLDDRDPMLVQLSTGELLLSYFRIDWTREPHILTGTYVVRSTDGGATWSQPVQIGSAMNERSERVWNGYLQGHAASHGQIVELANGELLAPLYGLLPDNDWHIASVVRSRDRGMTWLADDEVVLDAEEGVRCVEPVLTLLPDGELIALVRTEEAARLTRSSDGGHTWSAPERLWRWASSADTVVLADGSVFCVYGDASRQIWPSRPTVGTVIDEPHSSWDKGRTRLLYDSGNDTFDQANPAAVELADGSLLTLTYDIFRRQVIGIMSSRSDYLEEG